MLRYLDRLFDHVFWADALVLDRYRSADPAPGLDRFAHLLAAEHVWYVRLTGADGDVLPIWPAWTLEACAARAKANRAAYGELLAALTEADLAEKVIYRNSSGRTFHTARLDVLTHVALHGSYHRGQVMQSFRAGGVEPVNTDYITWSRLEP